MISEKTRRLTMNKINYEGRIFKSVSNTETGEVSNETTFYYHQKNDLVWAEYSGGAIVFGTLIAKVTEDGVLEMRYQHLNSNNELIITSEKSFQQNYELLED